ncbi:MAG: thioredoxin [Bacteroidales bacterium]
MQTFKVTFLFAALFAFISCGNSSADSSSEGKTYSEQGDVSSVQQDANQVGSMDEDPKEKQSGSASEDKNQEKQQSETSKSVSDNESTGKVIQMNKAMFLEKVFNYEDNPEEWKFRGDRPCIIDFYADWCGPCKRIAPIMDELAEEYKGKITIYKIDTDKEKELAQVFGIRSIPSIMYCPAEGRPYMYKGAFPKAKYLELLNKHFEL